MTLILGEEIVVEVVIPPTVTVSINPLTIPLVTVLYPSTTTVIIDDLNIPEISIPALPGPRGDKGDPGIPGANGTGLKSYTHNQVLPLDIWIIEHPLDYIPAVTVIDSAGSVVLGNVTYSGQLVIVSFSAGFSGTAYLS